MMSLLGSEFSFRALRHGRQYLRHMALAEEGWKNSTSTGRAMTQEERGWRGRSWPGPASWTTRRCSASSTPTAAKLAAPMCWWTRLNGPRARGPDGGLQLCPGGEEAREVSGAYGQESKQTVKRRDGMAYVEIRDLAASQVLVMASHPEKEEGAVV